MTSKSTAKVSFWVFAFTTLAGYFLGLMVLIIPPTNLTAVVTLGIVVALLNLIGVPALVVLLYSLTSMLGVFGDKPSNEDST